ncbi:hypothetical protein [Limosilactobacillus fermentum]|uniref:hypothetical protein n=1 Tax=Limosilactobacillus fermentum TaxID=1613 RepID=UPI00194E9439|nr:hypothetical protein [Limosilactobacillus fermentum]BCQ31554.1 hypothetical protein ikematsu_08710 [Limosilactobacillus fermentum]
MPEQYQFNQLNDEAQTVAVMEFAPFYVVHFKHDDLEIIAALADDRLVAEINHVLGENRQGTIEHDTAVSLRMTVAAYRGVLAALDMTYDQRGHTTTTWQQWYADKHAGLIKEN